MKAVIQRVSRAQVTIRGGETRKTGPGLLILLGVGRGDSRETGEKLAAKIASLRIFEDEKGKMNLSVKDTRGDALVVSQFTLFADTARGNRPGFSLAAPPEEAVPLYEYFVSRLEKELGKPVPTGEFGAGMDVELVNDGPVTILLDTRENN